MKPTSQWLFEGESGDTRGDIIRWWEERRLSFNTYVGLVGIIAWFLVLIVGGAAVKSGTDFAEPMSMLFGPVFYAIFANICYTFGWIVDVVAFCGSPRKGLFRSGFIFFLVVTALPGVWAAIAYLITVHTGRKLD